MSGSSPNEVTQLLLACRTDPQAIERLMSLVYEELRRRAHQYMRVERSDHTLQTTALVHEAYLKLVNMEVDWRDRAHFFAVAARSMRRILVDHARAQRAARRGEGQARLPLRESLFITPQPSADVVALDEAMTRLADFDERKSRVVELHFFGGLNYDEIARTLEISVPTVQRDMRMARAWLHRELGYEADDGS